MTFESPADVLRKIRDTLWISAVEGSITQVFLNWASGSVLTGYMLYLGAGPRELALVASVPLLAQMIGPVAAWLVGHLGSRKRFLAATAAVGRGVWLLAVLLPLVNVPSAHRLELMILLVAFSSLFQACAGPAWLSLMADVVPEDIRGRYFGLRIGIIGVVGMVANLAAGWYLDHTVAPAGFQMVFLVAVLCAVAGIYLYSLHYEPAVPRTRPSLPSTVLAPLRDANFRRFLFFSMFWQAAVMVAAPFVIPYFFQYLNMTFTQVAIWAAIGSTCALVTSPLWGRIADHVGHKAVLAITTFLAGSIHPLCWMLATPGHLAFIWISGVVDALSWGGIHPSMLNLSIASAPRNSRMAYIAILGVANGIVGFTFGVLSGPLLKFLLPHDVWLLGYHWTGYHSLFLISGILRMQAWRFLRQVREPEAWPARDVLRAILNWSLNNLPWR